MLVARADEILLHEQGVVALQAAPLVRVVDEVGQHVEADGVAGLRLPAVLEPECLPADVAPERVGVAQRELGRDEPEDRRGADPVQDLDKLLFGQFGHARGVARGVKKVGTPTRVRKLGHVPTLSGHNSVPTFHESPEKPKRKLGRTTRRMRRDFWNTTG